MKTLEKLIELREKVAYASSVAFSYYDALVTEVQTGKLLCDFNYGGLKITTIWEAKPIAWRPRPAYEFSFLDMPTSTSRALPPLPEGLDIIKSYFAATLAEKDAFSAFDAEYLEVVAALLRGELNPNIMVLPATGSYIQLDTVVFRIYEVKVVK